MEHWGEFLIYVIGGIAAIPVAMLVHRTRRPGLTSIIVLLVGGATVLGGVLWKLTAMIAVGVFLALGSLFYLYFKYGDVTPAKKNEND